MAVTVTTERIATKVPGKYRYRTTATSDEPNTFDGSAIGIVDIHETDNPNRAQMSHKQLTEKHKEN